MWWARRPLAAARAVIFSQLVNDPAGIWEAQNPGRTPNAQQRGAFTKRRQELFSLIEDLVRWESTTDQEILNKARAEIYRSWREVCDLNKQHPQADMLFNPARLPGLHDPFAGGGAIPLEAQRLGLESYASDLNPVAVLINKAMIEIPPKFAGIPPVNPEWQNSTAASKLGRDWSAATGLAEDVRYYGKRMRDQAQRKIGHLYPQVEITAGMAEARTDLKPLVGEKLTIIACLWARTVNSPSPAFSHVAVPLITSFVLGTKEGKQAYVQATVSGSNYQFTVRMGNPPEEAHLGTTAGKRKAFRCLVSGSPIDYNYIRDEAQAGRMGERLMTIVAEGPKGRIYLDPTERMELLAASAKPTWRPDLILPENTRDFKTPNYGLKTFGALFNSRQLVTLNTFSDLISGIEEEILQHARTAGLKLEGKGIEEGGCGAKAYAEALAIYLAFAISRSADYGSSICSWHNGPKMEALRNTFSRQAIPMVWDFAEGNPLSNSSGNWLNNVEFVAKVIDKLPAVGTGYAIQADAQRQQVSEMKVISTDPPYYDNIGYADLSDFFYVWLRPTLRQFLPVLMSTISVPKTDELVATPYRHGGNEKAEAYFLKGMTCAMTGLANSAHPGAPLAIYYAFKQSETEGVAGTASTGWETFLQAVIDSGLMITGTWPMRTELANKVSGMGNNMLASSIVLVCRKRSAAAAAVSRRVFIRELNSILPGALDEMTKGSGRERSPVAPVDLSQAIIGPGMAVFSKYSSVLEADGSAMSVRTALQLINRFLAEDDFDTDTQFCLSWFEQKGWKDGPFGEADTLARGKGTSVEGVKDAGVIQSGGGKVRLLKWSEYPLGWDPLTDNRTPIWEALHHLIRALKRDGGEIASGALLAALGGKAEAIRQLAYRLYTLCERLGQAEDARAYNELITSWTGIETAAAAAPKPNDGQLPGFENN
jgi:putative DNA methylase